MTRPSPIFGAYSKSRSTNASDSQIVNLFPEMIEMKDGRSTGYLHRAPGLVWLLTVGDGPIRGMKQLADALYVVSGNTIYRVTPELVSTEVGSLSTSAGMVSIITNGTQIAFFDGYSGWMTTENLALYGGYPLTGGTINSSYNKTTKESTNNLTKYGAGSNYATGDTIVLEQSGGVQDASAIATVTGITKYSYVETDLQTDSSTTTTTYTVSGAVSSFTVTQGGAFSSQPNYLTQSSTSGSGSGFVLVDPTFSASVDIIQITLPFTGDPTSATYQDGYGLVNSSSSEDWYQSDYFDLSVWEALNYSTANSQPDNVVALASMNRQIFVFKDDHAEVWYNGAASGFVFERQDGVFLEFGTNAAASVALAGQSICFVTQNMQGGREVRRIQGYDPKRISTHALEARLATYESVADAVAYSYLQEGHLFYVVNFPSGGETWACDLTESERAGVGLWHQRAAFSNGNFERHWGQCAANWPATGMVYQPRGIEIETPQEIVSAGSLDNLASTFSAFTFATWAALPEDGTDRGFWFGDQTDDASPGTGGVQIGIFNSTADTAGAQLVINLYDASLTQILAATFAITWKGWKWIGVSCNTQEQTLQVYFGDEPQEATSITWSSSNAISNTTSKGWHLIPGEKS